MGSNLEQSESNLTSAVASDVVNCLDASLTKISHCLEQLTDEQVWWRPHHSMNSIGNLILHLSGNVRQWITSGVGGEPDVRNRPEEFSEQRRISKDDLVHELAKTVAQAKEVVSRLTAPQFLEQRRIQGFEVNCFGAIFDSITHFKGHTQEIICLTRMQLGDTYRFHWQPTTPEHGAPANDTA